MKIFVYYQPFEINSSVFNSDKLVLNYERGTHIITLTVEKLQELGYEFEEGCDYAEYSQAIFHLLNLRHDELNIPKRCFSTAGHTSMSVGDYIVYRPDMVNDDSTVHICAAAGWKVIKDLLNYTNARNLCLDYLKNLPADVFIAMANMLKNDVSEVSQIISAVIDTRCENHCPHCNATDPDIEWAMKDIQDDVIYQNAYCKKCNTEFTEEYRYTRTEIDEQGE